MRLTVRATLLILLSLIIISCTGRNKRAANYLLEAEKAYKDGNYSLAKLKIDSIKELFPKDFDEINSGFQLMQEVRMAENKRNIAFCDSMLREHYSELNTMITKFDYVRDDRYQEFGEYFPKIYPYSSSLERNGVRCGVNEKGDLFVESILSGTSLRHNKIRFSSNDNSFAETNVVTADGLNYRFSTIGKTYEIVRFGGNDENNVAQYVYSYRDKPITVHFIGNRTITINLTNNAKNAITQSFELSNLLKSIEQLKLEKEKSEVLIRYLQNRKE